MLSLSFKPELIAAFRQSTVWVSKRQRLITNRRIFVRDTLTFTFPSRTKWKRSPHSLSSGRDGGRKMIPPQTSSSLCKACRWYADLAVGWHLKVVNCANLCFRLERSRIVSLSSWTTPSFPAPSPPSTPPHPPPPHQHSCRKGRGEDVGGGGAFCWFLRWPHSKVAECFFKVVHEYLFAQTVWKMKINLQ